MYKKIFKTFAFTLFLSLNLYALQNQTEWELRGGVRFIIDEGLAPTLHRGSCSNKAIKDNDLKKYNDLSLSDSERNNIISCNGKNELYEPVVLAYPSKNIKGAPSLYQRHLAKLVDITKIVDSKEYGELSNSDKNNLMTRISKFDRNNFFLAMTPKLAKSYKQNRNQIINFFLDKNNGEFNKIKDSKTFNMYAQKLDQIISIADSALAIWDKNKEFYDGYLTTLNNVIKLNRFGLDEEMEKEKNYINTIDACNRLAINWYKEVGSKKYSSNNHNNQLILHPSNNQLTLPRSSKLRDLLIGQQKNLCIRCEKDKDAGACNEMDPYMKSNANIGDIEGDKKHNSINYLVSNLDKSFNWNSNNAFNKFSEVFANEMELPIFKYFAYADISMHKDFLTNNMKDLIDTKSDDLLFKDKSAILRFTATANIVRKKNKKANIYPKIVKFHAIDLLTNSNLKNRKESNTSIEIYETNGNENGTMTPEDTFKKVTATVDNNCANYGHKYILVVKLPFAENFNADSVNNFYTNKLGYTNLDIGCYDEKANRVVAWVKNVTLPPLNIDSVKKDYFDCIREYFDGDNEDKDGLYAKNCSKMERTILENMFGTDFVEGFKEFIKIPKDTNETNATNGFIGMYVFGHTLSKKELINSVKSNGETGNKTNLETYILQGIPNTKEGSTIEQNSINWYQRIRVKIDENKTECRDAYLRSEPIYSVRLNMSTCDSFLAIRMNPQSFKTLSIGNNLNDNTPPPEGIPEFVEVFNDEYLCKEKYLSFPYVFKDNYTFSEAIAKYFGYNNITLNGKKLIPETLVTSYYVNNPITKSYEYLYDKTRYNSIFTPVSFFSTTGVINDIPIIYEKNLPNVSNGGKVFNFYDYNNLGDISCYESSHRARVLNRETGKLGI